jgi:hypothetical protein
VYWNGHKWQAQFAIKGRVFYLGVFEHKQDAALAYNRAATQHYGEFAYLNEVAS